GTGDDALDSVDGRRCGRIDRSDARMRMWRTQHLHVQHTRQGHVACIFEAPRNLAWCIDASHVLADDSIYRGVVFEKRACRQSAIVHVARKLYRIENLLIARAAANVATKTLLDFLATRQWIGAD